MTRFCTRNDAEKSAATFHRLGFCLLGIAILAGCGEEASDDPTPSGALESYELREPVEILIDDSNVPHLYAKSALDAFYAQGYQQARDALFMLEVTRRSAAGTLSEVLGEGSLESDRQARTFDFQRWALASIQLMKANRPADYNLLVAYVGGVNRRVQEVLDGSAPLPSEFTAHEFSPALFTPADAIAIGVRIQVGFSSTLSFDILNTVLAGVVENAEKLPIFAPYANAFYMNPGALAAQWTTEPKGMSTPAALDPAKARALFSALESLYRNHGMGEGSNNWVVNGSGTDTGRPYLANDSHAGLTEPNRMHVVHVSGGEFDAVGVAFLGIPGVHVGHNRKIAWGATTNFADTMDLWDVSVDESTVELGGDTLPMETRDETIRVKQADGTMGEVPFTGRFVPGVGVILPSEILPVPKLLVAKGELLLGWPGFAPSDELFLFLDFDRSETLEDFESAVEIGKTGMQNWVGASAEGIRLRVRGLVPDRGPVAGRPRANRILDGSDPTTLWTGAMLPPEQLPALDGTQPFIVTANNDPWGHTADNDPLNDAFYYGSFYDPGFRAARVTSRLNELLLTGGIQREQMQALQTEVTSSLADGWLPLIEESMQAIGSEPTLAAFENRDDLVTALSRLSAWDRRMTRSSEEACLFRLFAAFVSRATLEPALGALFEGLDEAQPVTVQKMALLAHREDMQFLLGGKAHLLRVQALSDALLEQTTRGQGNAYTWGDLHRAVFKKPDGTETLVATDGDDTTPNVAQSHCWQEGSLGEHCRSTGGAVYRFVIGFDEDGTPNATFAVPAANASSTEDWVEGNYAPLRFRRADVESSVQEERALLPK